MENEMMSVKECESCRLWMRGRGERLEDELSGYSGGSRVTESESGKVGKGQKCRVGKLEWGGER